MSFPLPERRRTQTTYGTLPANAKAPAAPADAALARLAAAHPFTHQERPCRPWSPLDLVVAAPNDLKEKLAALTTRYHERAWTLAAFVAFAQPHVQQFAAESALLALGKPGPTDTDVWCLDTRGVLTLAVSKATYERLGLAGRALPWKEHSDVFIVRVALQAQAPALAGETCHGYGPKVQAALEAWDARRGPWSVVFHLPADAAEPETAARDVQPVVRTLQNVYVPQPELRLRPEDAGAAEEWDEEAAELFEWVGLAALGSERLRVYDRPDPYIAVYTPPAPNYTGSVVHARWTGLLPPQFVQSVVDIASEAPFACVVANAITISPVTYIPPPPSLRYPVRAPRAESEDTWSVVVQRLEGSEETRWLLAESIGKWDARWG